MLYNLTGINQQLFDGSHAEMVLADVLDDAGVTFGHMGWDYYDNSLELYDVPASYRLSDEARQICADAGFAVVYLNHVDQWETHYNLHEPTKKPWRVSYPHKRGESEGNIWVEDADPWNGRVANVEVRNSQTVNT